MTENETRRYVDVIYDLLSAYNNRGHRTLNYLTPNDAEKKENAEKLASAHNERYTKVLEAKKDPVYQVGEHVRIKNIGDKMTRGYNERFNQEYFEIIQVLQRMPIPMYQIKSMNTGEVIRGNFYSNELQPVGYEVFKIDKVISQRTRNRKKEVLVKWKGFDDSHNSWEPASSVRDINK